MLRDTVLNLIKKKDESKIHKSHVYLQFVLHLVGLPEKIKVSLILYSYAISRIPL